MNQYNRRILNLDLEIDKKNKIGSGSCGAVYRSNYKSLNIAVKKIKTDQINEPSELNIMKRFRHPFSPLLIGISYSNSEKLTIFTELVKGDTLDHYILQKNPSELEILIYLYQLSTVLTYFHKLGAIHRDIKPKNIMIDLNNQNLKLLDFGVSKLTNNTSTTTITLGTVLYMAPEIFKVYENFVDCDTSKCKITNKIDVWAFGCLVSEIFSNKKPWSQFGANNNNMIIGLLMNNTEFPVPKEINNSRIMNLIKNCTKINVRERYNSIEIKNELTQIIYELIKEKGKNFHTFICSDKKGDHRKKLLLLTKLKNILSFHYSSLLKLKKEKLNSYKKEVKKLPLSFNISSSTRDTKERKKSLTTRLTLLHNGAKKDNSFKVIPNSTTKQNKKSNSDKFRPSSQDKNVVQKDNSILSVSDLSTNFYKTPQLFSYHKNSFSRMTDDSKSIKSIKSYENELFETSEFIKRNLDDEFPNQLNLQLNVIFAELENYSKNSRPMRKKGSSIVERDRNLFKKSPSKKLLEDLIDKNNSFKNKSSSKLDQTEFDLVKHSHIHYSSNSNEKIVSIIHGKSRNININSNNKIINIDKQNRKL